ncbi:unnamed protein product [Umbelopsis ramanniana]
MARPMLSIVFFGARIRLSHFVSILLFRIIMNKVTRFTGAFNFETVNPFSTESTDGTRVCAHVATGFLGWIQSTTITQNARALLGQNRRGIFTVPGAKVFDRYFDLPLAYDTNAQQQKIKVFCRHWCQ